MTDDAIKYERIAKAQTFYSALGFKNIETPWMVSPAAIRATLPPMCRSFDTLFGSLVGSGEQGFIQLMLDGKLEPGCYQTTTPCFRDEANLDDLTRQWFVKLELISYQPADARMEYNRLVNNAMSCFFEVSDAKLLDAVQTDEGVNIRYNGVELGSYGIRKLGDHIWVYGTGLAEPRFSLAMLSQKSISAVESDDCGDSASVSQDQMTLGF